MPQTFLAAENTVRLSAAASCGRYARAHAMTAAAVAGATSNQRISVIGPGATRRSLRRRPRTPPLPGPVIGGTRSPLPNPVPERRSRGRESERDHARTIVLLGEAGQGQKNCDVPFGVAAGSSRLSSVRCGQLPPSTAAQARPHLTKGRPSPKWRAFSLAQLEWNGLCSACPAKRLSGCALPLSVTVRNNVRSNP